MREAGGVDLWPHLSSKCVPSRKRWAVWWAASQLLPPRGTEAREREDGVPSCARGPARGAIIKHRYEAEEGQGHERMWTWTPGAEVLWKPKQRWPGPFVWVWAESRDAGREMVSGSAGCRHAQGLPLGLDPHSCARASQAGPPVRVGTRAVCVPWGGTAGFAGAAPSTLPIRQAGSWSRRCLGTDRDRAGSLRGGRGTDRPEGGPGGRWQADRSGCAEQVH